MAATDGIYRRPPHAHDGSHDADHLPSSVVLDNMVYLDARTNASMAGGVTSNGVAVMVTLWAAHPPRISYFTVRFPGSSALPDENPRVLRTDGDLVLLRFLVGPETRSMYPQYNDYIVYQAGVNKLRVLPSHPTRLFSDLAAGLLRCRPPAAADDDDDGRFILASTRWTSRGHYALDLFDSMSWAWSSRSVHVESPKDFRFTTPNKAISLHGSSIGWVDLWNGILIFDFLGGDDNDTLQFIRLPMLVVPNRLAPRAMACTRGVSFSNGCLRFTEVWFHFHPVPGSDDGPFYVSQDWGAAMIKWLGPEKKWHVDCILKASEITMETSLSRLLPGLPHRHKATDTEYTLSRLHVGHPALSLHDDDVVYIMSKVDQMDDMRNKTI